MKTIGVLFGMENSFPGALVEHINARNLDGIRPNSWRPAPCTWIKPRPTR